MRKSTSLKSTGTIVEYVTSFNIDFFIIGNSKWAIVSHKSGGIKYLSNKPVSVPFNSQVGDTINIRYDEDDPTKIKCAFLSLP